MFSICIYQGQEDRKQKMQKIAKRVQKQQEWKRHRLAQEIQRSLEELDVKRRQLEQQGFQLEEALRNQGLFKRPKVQHPPPTEFVCCC